MHFFLFFFSCIASVFRFLPDVVRHVRSYGRFVMVGIMATGIFMKMRDIRYAKKSDSSLNANVISYPIPRTEKYLFFISAFLYTCVKTQHYKRGKKKLKNNQCQQISVIGCITRIYIVWKFVSYSGCRKNNIVRHSCQPLDFFNTSQFLQKCSFYITAKIVRFHKTNTFT